MNHFEACLMVLSSKVDSKVLRIERTRSKLKYCDGNRAKMVTVILQIIFIPSNSHQREQLPRANRYCYRLQKEQLNETKKGAQNLVPMTVTTRIEI